VHGLRTGIKVSVEVRRLGSVMKRKVVDIEAVECDETEDDAIDVFNFRVLRGDTLSLVLLKFISPALRFLKDNIDFKRFSMTVSNPLVMLLSKSVSFVFILGRVPSIILEGNTKLGGN